MASTHHYCENCALQSLFHKSFEGEKFDIIHGDKYEISYNKGDVIIKQGDEIKEFIYLKKGLVKLYRTGTTKKEQIISIAKPFDFVSLLSVFSDNHYNYSVAALENTVTCNIILDEIKELIHHNGNFAMGIIEKMNKVTDDIIINSLEIKQRQVFGRLAFILLYFSENIYNNMSFELPISRKEIAELIGMTTENVIRTMSNLKSDGVIKINGKTIEIIDKSRLSMICNAS